MSLVWNPWGAYGIVTGLAVAAMAALVYFTRPHRPQNRRLTTFLLMEAVVAITGTGLMFLSSDMSDAYGWQAPTVIALLAVGPLYLRFIATLDTPLAHPLRHRVVDIALLTAAGLLPIAWFLRPEAFVAGMVDVWFVPWELIPGAGWIWMFQLLSLCYLYGLVCAVHAYLRTPRGSELRRRNRLFAIAFGWRDLSFAFFLAGPILIPGMTYDTHYGGLIWAAGPATTQIVFVPLLVYGILKGQLFDIDLKIKIAVQRSTIVALFAVLVFIVSEVIEQLLGVDQLVPAILAAGAIAVAMRPLALMSERFADRLMPGVQDNEEYRRVRKIEVYRAAVESALEDDTITEKERGVLGTLAQQLGLDVGQVRRIEQEAVGSAALS